MLKIKNTIINFLLLSFLSFFAALSQINAAAGDLDTTFAATGFSGAVDLTAVAVQSDGKILATGNFSTINGTATAARFGRINTDGTLDTTFNVGGAGLTNNAINQILVQPDGKIIIAGTFTSYNGTSRGRIARLNPNGSLDTTFVPPGSGFNSTVHAFAVQTDGKIVVVGDFSAYGGNSSVRVARVNADGTFDTSFAVGTGATGAEVVSVAIQTDGNIVIGGGFTSYNGVPINRVARIIGNGANAGQLDTTFNVGTGANSFVLDVDLDISGGVIIAGSFSAYNGNTAQRIARLSSTGVFDSSFSANIGTGASAGANSNITAVSIDAGGMIYCAGIFTAFGGATHNRLVRLFSNGVVDAGFNPSVSGGTGTIVDVALQADGKAIIGGGFQRLTDNEVRFNIARVNPDGTNDNDFEAAFGGGQTVYKTLIKPDGKILVAGNFDFAGRISQTRIAQLNEDGTVDTTFMSNQANNGASREIYALAVQTDGKILIGGLFTNYDNTTINRIARLNTDGSIDTTFAVGTGANSIVWAIAVQADGKIIIGGDFTNYNGTTVSRLARLETDGTLDSTFTPPTVSSTVNDILIQADGKILIGGNFTNFDGTGINRFVRLESNGTRDVNFNVGGTGAGATVNTMAVEADGRILIGGAFTTYNGTTHNRIARINTDGTDASFTASITGTSAEIRGIGIQVDGKIVIGGSFSNCNGVTISNICRYNADGTRDSTFSIPTGFSGSIYTVALQTDGKILIGGNITSYNNTSRIGLARLQFGNVAIWNGSVSADWNTAANWTPAAVPSAATPIIFPSVAVPFEPTLDSSCTVQSLTIQTGRTITIPAGLTLTANGAGNSGTITGEGTFALGNFNIVNNGTISTAFAQVSVGGSHNLSGTGAFSSANILSISGGASLSLLNDHQFGTIRNLSGTLSLSNRTIRLSGAGDALDAGTNFDCFSCTIEYNGTAAQTVQQVPTNYDNLIINNPAGATLTETILVNDSAALTDGIVNTGAFELQIGANAMLTRTNGYVNGKIRKFFANGGENFTFHTGTANGYSPVEFNANITSNSNNSVTIQAFQTNQPNLNAATSLARYWRITADSNITSADIVFNYRQTDVAGNENAYRIFKVENGAPTSFANDCANTSPCVDATANTATINNVTQFSDWTLAEIAPTAASVSVGGRVTANGRGVAKATVSLIGANGSRRFALTNSFGYYRFDDVEVGQICVISIRHKEFEFASQVINVSEEMSAVNFTAEQNKQ